MTKFIVVTGGVVSGLGKGIASASIAKILKQENDKIVVVKCDGYLNVDPGTMNPVEHGEVFVLDDGTEVDMDFGHYERFLNIATKGEWNLTSGKMFLRLIEKEREGKFLGKTIQIFPHMAIEVMMKLEEIAEQEKPDLMMIEIGGTIGDIENSWFVEAVKRLKKKYSNDVFFVHLTYVPYLDNVKELKTKPAQRDIGLLRQHFINPDIIIARSKYKLPEKLKEKLAFNIDLEKEKIIAGIDIDSIYEVPLNFIEQGIDKEFEKLLNRPIKPYLEKWSALVKSLKNPKKRINVAIAGKYTTLQDSYASVIEALYHAGAHLDAKVNIEWIETTELEDGKINLADCMKDIDAVIVPGGFGKRGTEGKMKVIRYARENKIPYLGLCLGLQLAVIEFARNVCNLDNTNSTEFDKDVKHNVIDYLDEQRQITKLGGTMRLGSYKADLKEGSIVSSLYAGNEAHERHRHRYEVNPSYHHILEEHGLLLSGMSPDRALVEFIELPSKEHPYFVATQSHPELKSKFEFPAPLFYGLIQAALKLKDNSPL